MSETGTAPADLVVEYEVALHRMMDENADLRAELSTLIAWINGDADDALTTLQRLYLDINEPTPTRIKAAQAAVGYERPKLQATASLVYVDFRERVRQARLKAPYAEPKVIEHEPESA